MRADGAGVTALSIGPVAMFYCVEPLIITRVITAFVVWLSEFAYVLIAGGFNPLLCAILWRRYGRANGSDLCGVKSSSEDTE